MKQVSPSRSLFPQFISCLSMIRVVMQFSLNAEPWQEKSVTGGLYFSNKGPNLTVPSPLPIGKSIAGPEVQEYKAVPVEIGLADQTVKVMNAYRQARWQAEWS